MEVNTPKNKVNIITVVNTAKLTSAFLNKQFHTNAKVIDVATSSVYSKPIANVKNLFLY